MTRIERFYHDHHHVSIKIKDNDDLRNNLLSNKQTNKQNIQRQIQFDQQQQKKTNEYH